MVGPFPGVPNSFGALRETLGPLFVRCDVCRRYARLYLAEICDTDYRTKTFSCCRCGTILSPTRSDPWGRATRLCRLLARDTLEKQRRGSGSS
jgi:hypothetical protein